MNSFLSLVVHTANILGIFADPFEFEGDYGSDLNPIRQVVFETVVSKEAMARSYTDREIKLLMGVENAQDFEIVEYRNALIDQAIKDEEVYGPTLSKLVTQELIEEFKRKQVELEDVGFTKECLDEILLFLERYRDRKIFRFLRNNPSELLSLDKILRDQAARSGKSFDMPILGSTKLLSGKSSLELKMDLMDAVFKRETFALTKSEDLVRKAIRDQEYFAFSSPAGQLFFYWLYQALNLHLISENPQFINEINKVKEVFARTLGDSVQRAQALKEKLIASNTGVLFTQESDHFVPQLMMENGLFLPIDRQNPKDGTFVLLRSDIWEPEYEVIDLQDYDGAAAGRINVILATKKDSGERFLLASGHGHSTKSEDGRRQISLVMEKFHELTDGTLQVLIGIDANTKTEEDVRLFREHLESLGLQATQTGPTTIKRRMVTAQHSKAGRLAIDEEDYLIILKPDLGGQFHFSSVTVGFKEGMADTTQPLPNMENPSDHYPVGAVLLK